MSIARRLAKLESVMGHAVDADSDVLARYIAARDGISLEELHMEAQWIAGEHRGESVADMAERVAHELGIGVDELIAQVEQDSRDARVWAKGQES